MTAPPVFVVAANVPTLLPAVFAAGLAAVHLYAWQVLSLEGIPRSWWLSLSGGSAVAYVFVHVLPEIQSAGRTISQSESMLIQFEQHVYLIARLGFTTFYGLEQFVQVDRARSRGDDQEHSGVFWVHIGSFAADNVVVGYLLLHREESGIVSLTTFFVAMALHFVVNDNSLRNTHGEAYHDYGRWALAVAVFAGLAVGYLRDVSELVLAVLFAFLAGGIVLNVVKEEVPADRQSRFWAFAAGATGYALLLLLVQAGRSNRRGGSDLSVPARRFGPLGPCAAVRTSRFLISHAGAMPPSFRVIR